MLLSDDSDGVRTLTLNRPRRKNAINPELWIALRDALNAAGRDRSVRALVITGAGGSFCSGADISVPDDIHPKYKLQRLTDVALALHELPIPTVAKVTGVAVGAGWNLALGCDLVVATPGIDVLPDLFETRPVDRPRRFLAVAETRWPATGEAARRCWPKPSTPREAYALNLVTWVVPAAEIDAFVDDLAGRLAAGPPFALAQSKALLNEGADRTLRDALANEARAQIGNFATRMRRPPMPPSPSGGSRRLLVGGRCQNPATQNDSE